MHRRRNNLVQVAPAPVGTFDSRPLGSSGNDIAALRRGDFELIDPKGGHAHWTGSSADKSIQKQYLKELRKTCPNGGMLAFYRSIIERGVEQTMMGIRANNENTALLSALLLSVCASESHIDDPVNMCQMQNMSAPGVQPRGLPRICNEQLNVASAGVAFCLLTMTFCITNIGFLNFLSADSAAYHMTTYSFSILYAPLLLLIGTAICFGYAVVVHVGLQKAVYTTGFDSHKTTSFLWSWAFVALMVWGVIILVKMTIDGLAFVKEFRKRDLDSTGQGFSDTFLSSLGLIHGTEETQEKPAD